MYPLIIYPLAPSGMGEANSKLLGFPDFGLRPIILFGKSIDYQDGAPTDQRNSDPLSTPHTELQYRRLFTIYLTCVFSIYIFNPFLNLLI